MKISQSKIKNKQQRRERPATVSRRRPITDRKFVHFPQVKGRVVENIELLTMADFHSITIDFRDKTQFNLILEPSLLIDSNLADRSSGEQRILRRWPTVRTLTNRD